MSNFEAFVTIVAWMVIGGLVWAIIRVLLVWGAE